MNMVHEAPDRPRSATAHDRAQHGEVVEMTTNPSMENIGAVLQRGSSVQQGQGQGQEGGGASHYRGVQMTSYQVPDSLRPGVRRQLSPGLGGGDTSMGYGQSGRGEAGESVWRAPAW
jgi:hypothetical protein